MDNKKEVVPFYKSNNEIGDYINLHMTLAAATYLVYSVYTMYPPMSSRDTRIHVYGVGMTGCACGCESVSLWLRFVR